RPADQVDVLAVLGFQLLDPVDDVGGDHLDGRVAAVVRGGDDVLPQVRVRARHPDGEGGPVGGEPLHADVEVAVLDVDPQLLAHVGGQGVGVLGRDVVDHVRRDREEVVGAVRSCDEAVDARTDVVDELSQGSDLLVRGSGYRLPRGRRTGRGRGRGRGAAGSRGRRGRGWGYGVPRMSTSSVVLWMKWFECSTTYEVVSTRRRGCGRTRRGGRRSWTRRSRCWPGRERGG